MYKTKPVVAKILNLMSRDEAPDIDWAMQLVLIAKASRG
jgi:hypothetical protein